MAQEQQSYVVPPSRKPSYLNGSALVGWAAGMITGVPFLPVAGAALGSYLGKKKMEQQAETGRVVSPPSMWNKGTFVGGVMAASAPVAGAALGFLVAGTGGVGLLGIATVAAFGAAGAWIGGKIVQRHQAKEYEKAENYVLQHGEYMPPQQQAQSPSQAPQQGPQAPSMDQQAALSQASQQMDPHQLAHLQALASQGQRMGPPQPESMTEKLAAQSRPQDVQQQR